MGNRQDEAWMQAIACLPEERAVALSRAAEQERIEELRLRCG